MLTPAPRQIFRPFFETPLHKVRVVMVFPEPYSRLGKANGLALSYKTQSGKHIQAEAPQFFRVVMDELQSDMGVSTIKRADLHQWARRGVLLWNAVPTTYKGMANAHKDWGWHELTQEVLDTVYLVNPDTVFVFFGATAFRYELPSDALILEVPLPTGFRDSTFEGCELFSTVNTMLKQRRHKGIDWRT